MRAKIQNINFIWNLYFQHKCNGAIEGGGVGGLAVWLASRTKEQGVSGSRPGQGAVRRSLEQVIFT